MHVGHASYTFLVSSLFFFFFFFFNDTATTEIYTLSLHDALPIYRDVLRQIADAEEIIRDKQAEPELRERSEEHTSELQSQSISYAVFCLKKKQESLDEGTAAGPLPYMGRRSAGGCCRAADPSSGHRPTAAWRRPGGGRGRLFFFEMWPRPRRLPSFSSRRPSGP